MPKFFIHSEQIQNKTLQISGPLARHLAGSLRHQAGDHLFVIDEKEQGYEVQLEKVSSTQILAQVLNEKKRPPSSHLKITLGQSILKAKKFDWLLQKATELGVHRIIPLTTERTVVQLKPERLKSQYGRWQSIVKESAQQSGRWNIPHLDEPQTFKHWVQQGSSFDLMLLPWENEVERGLLPTLQEYQNAKSILLLIGPEGGFSEEEVLWARNHQAVTVSLGPRVLRSETAGLAAITMLQCQLGDLGHVG